MKMEKPIIKIIKEIPIEERKTDFDIFLMDIEEGLKKNQFITLPLKKVSKHGYDSDGKPIKVIETEVNVKKSVRIVEIAG